MEKMLGVILSIILGFWLIGFIGKWILRYWLLSKQRQMEEQMRNGGANGQGGNFRGFYTNFGGGAPNDQRKTQKPEGEITVEKTEEPKKGVSKEIGEYVDFEEVK